MQPSGFRPDNIRAASLLKGVKNILGKACVTKVHNHNIMLYICESWKLAYKKNIKHDILIRRRFIDIKSLHVMYSIMDHLMGQWAYEL